MHNWTIGKTKWALQKGNAAVRTLTVGRLDLGGNIFHTKIHILSLISLFYLVIMILNAILYKPIWQLFLR